jgi:hypothetical protein
MAAVLPLSEFRRKAPYLHFTRGEFFRILGLYSQRVMTGEWRDYAISHAPGMACFFIFRHAADSPLFVISKLETRGKDRWSVAARHGRFLVTSNQKKLVQSHSLDEVLRVFDRPLRLVTS